MIMPHFTPDAIESLGVYDRTVSVDTMLRIPRLNDDEMSQKGIYVNILTKMKKILLPRVDSENSSLEARSHLVVWWRCSASSIQTRRKYYSQQSGRRIPVENRSASTTRKHCSNTDNISQTTRAERKSAFESGIRNLLS
jgi:hypothetical protein